MSQTMIKRVPTMRRERVDTESTGKTSRRRGTSQFFAHAAEGDDDDEDSP